MKQKKKKKNHRKDTIKTNDKIQTNGIHTNAERKNAIFCLICGLFLWSARRGFGFFFLSVRQEKPLQCDRLSFFCWHSIDF